MSCTPTPSFSCSSAGAGRRIYGAPTGHGADGCIEYTALVNIRPAQGNPSMEIQDPELVETLHDIIFQLIGQGEEP